MEDTVAQHTGAQHPDSQKAPVFDNPDRNLAMELVRATEAAAIRAVPFSSHCSSACAGTCA